MRDTILIILKWAKLYGVSLNKCSAVAELGDDTIDIGRKVGGCSSSFLGAIGEGLKPKQLQGTSTDVIASGVITLDSTLPSSFQRKDQIVYNRLRIGHTRLTHSYLIDHTDVLTVINNFLSNTY